MKTTILVINDQSDLCHSLFNAWPGEDHDVCIASDGREAVHALRETAFDLVLLDLDMPSRNGWESLCQIITVSLTLPLIVIEGAGRQRVFKKKGVTAVLQKPVDVKALVDAIEQTLAETAQTRQQRREFERVFANNASAKGR
jgi:two-component system response regulator (stage 0 sporulation protein F)